MTPTQPPITATTHPLPFDRLSPRDFERLCLWLIEREGWERAEHLGAAGSEQGRDVVAHKPTPHGEELWYFQCKRYRSINARTLKDEVDKYLRLVQEKPHLRPTGVVFVVSCDVSAKVREEVGDYCGQHKLAYEFWALTELDMRVKRHPDIVAEFFQADRGRPLTEELDDYLTKAVSAYEARMYQLVARPPAPPDQPYKFLYAFEIEDADIFFGRDTASEAFHQTILKDRLTVLHAKSGAGKTSLLNAGLSPRLIREGRLPVYARAYEDPIRAIKQAIAPPAEPWPELLPKLTLHEFLRLICTHLSRQTQELVVILDQFEEFFIFWPERDHRQLFIDALADGYEDKSLPVRFVIGIRGDYFTQLATFQRRLPHIFHNEYYVEAMTREEAQTAVIGPVAKLGRPVTYEQALLDGLLDDLARGGMELPHLQIVCTKLYEVLAAGETTITLASYEKLGRAEGVLGGYLKSVLDRLPGKGESIAKEILKELVSSEATKRVLSYGTLAARVEAERDELEDILARLVDARLLHRAEVAGDVVHEMAHEHLIEEIEKWIDQSDLEFKQAEELLMREVANWRVYGTLIPGDRLKLLYAQRERLTGLDDEVWECILYSALQANLAVEDWARLVDQVGEKLLLIALDNQSELMRRAAIRGLGAIWGIPEISRLGHQHSDVRRKAAEALGKLGDPRITDLLITALRDEDNNVRQAVVQELGKIGEPAVEPLVAALGDEDSKMRTAVANVLAQLCDPRPGVGVDPATNLPDIVWCEIPAGPFLMSDENLQYFTEEYRVGRYPITNAQFAAFVKAGGYQEKRYWTEAGWDQKEQAGWTGPSDYVDPYNLPNHPVVGVSWYEAVAFCRWLTEQLHQSGELGADEEITLPTEPQWEKAARSTDGRRYPWGNDPDPNRANYGDTGIGTTSAVGCFPGGASPYDVEDMSGNVWEWCRTKWKSNYENYQEDNDLEGNALRVARGGSFRCNRWNVRSASRDDWYPDARGRLLGYGFRVVASPILSLDSG